MENTKEVWFSYYCTTCKYRNVKEDGDPCNECLAYPHNENSNKPVNYIKDSSLKSIDPTPNCLEKIAHLHGDYTKIFPNGYGKN